MDRVEGQLAAVATKSDIHELRAAIDESRASISDIRVAEARLDAIQKATSSAGSRSKSAIVVAAIGAFTTIVVSLLTTCEAHSLPSAAAASQPPAIASAKAQ